MLSVTACATTGQVAHLTLMYEEITVSRRCDKFRMGIYLVLMFVAALIANGCRKSHEGLSDTDLFEEFVLSPVPASVSVLRVHRPKYYYGKVYVMNFKIDGNDVQTILDSRSFVEYSNWQFDPKDRYSPLEWKHTLELKDPVDDKKESQKIVQTDMISLDVDENGQNKPGWFRPDQWLGSRLYVCDIRKSPDNPNNIIRHAIIYNKELGEAYYLIYRTGGL